MALPKCGSYSEAQFKEANQTTKNIRVTESTACSVTSNRDFNFFDNERCEGAICEYSESYAKMQIADNSSVTESVQQGHQNAIKGVLEGVGKIFRTLISSFNTLLFQPVTGIKVREMGDDAGNYRDQATAGHNSHDSSCSTRIKTLESSLKQFGLHRLFGELEKSLEGVRRNKISKKDHEECLKVADKELQKLCLTNHPDRVCNRGGTDQDLENAQEFQSALNATRTVLKILTEAFLRDMSFDYKYEYFEKLDISLLVNENELNNKMNRVLYKISELSEIKRMNIVGEIREFLVESQRCVGSYLEGEMNNDFKMYRCYAHHHLGKIIEGYKKFENECDKVDQECSDEGDDNMRTIVRRMAGQSHKELLILTELDRFARSSVKGNFKIYPISENMDHYYIWPFVYYVNVISICSLIFQNGHSWFKNLKSHVMDWMKNAGGIFPSNPNFEKERPPFLEAYYLASYFYDQNRCKRKVAEIVGTHNLDFEIEDVKNKLNAILNDVAGILKEEFRVDAYNEGKTNRMQLMEELLKVEEILKDVQKKENTLREYMRQCEEGSKDNPIEHNLMEKEGEVVGKKIRNT